ncbi:MAG: NADH-quinone oxidoreductase subunit A [Deltaproteobacteria bacterium]|nr:NADH-quinone oxidoreductase subunit A [Deltaproteobacteria bacterium]
MAGPWGAVFSFLLVAAVAIGGLAVLARVFRVRARVSSPLARRPYECGEDPEGVAWIQFHPRYYVIALFFVLFDVEAVFFFPWGVAVGRLGGAGLMAMLTFVGILMLGWWYALRKGALKWQ